MTTELTNLELKTARELDQVELDLQPGSFGASVAANIAELQACIALPKKFCRAVHDLPEDYETEMILVEACLPLYSAYTEM